MIPLKTKIQKALKAAGEIVAPQYTLTEIKGEIEMMIESVRDDVEREVGE